MALKLNMTKAFDRIEWVFIDKIILKLGFPRAFVDLVMKCICLATFSYIINGVPFGLVSPNRGLCQGDPISLFLFLLCLEGLLSLILHAVASKALLGLRICSNVPVISHLLFVDDSILFCKASQDQAETHPGPL